MCSRFLFFLVGLLSLPFLGIGQKLIIRDASNGDPLEAVTVNSPSKQKLWVTDKYGSVDISALKGIDEIIIRSIGYKSITRTYLSLKKDDFLVFLEPNMISLEQIVVSASKWSQGASGVPSRVTKISPYQAELIQPQTTADLLGMSGEVFIQKSQQGGGSPMIRGFSTNRLLYSVDGVRMNTAIFRSGNIQNVISLDPFAMQSVEVLFGPGSTIYGSDAIGGVMSFATKEAKFALDSADQPRMEANANVRYASANNENTAHFDFNLGYEQWAFLSSISYQSYDDLRMGSNGPDDYLKDFTVERQNGVDQVLINPDPREQVPSAYNQLNAMQKIAFKPSENWDFTYGFHFSETSSYGRYDRHNRTRDGLPRYAEWRYGPQKWMMNHLQINHKSSGRLFDQLRINLALQNFEESRISRDLNDFIRSTQIEKVDAYSVNVDFRKNLTKGSSVFYGAEYVLNEVNSNGLLTDVFTNEVSEGAPRYPNALWQSSAIYLNYENKFAAGFSFQGGLRYNILGLRAEFSPDFYNLPFESAQLNPAALTGSAGITYKTTNDWLWSVNLATAFRAPNVDDIGKVFDSEPGSVVVPNPELQSEYAYNADISLSKVIGRFLKLDVTAFYTYLNNAMVRRDFRLGERDSIVYQGELSKVQAIQNAANANVYGVQLATEWKFLKDFTAATHVNFQRGTEETDDGTIGRSRHAAPLFGLLRLNYRYKKWRAELNSQFQAAVSAENLPISEQSKTEIYALNEAGDAYSPAWYTLNFKFNYRFNANFNLSAGLENITDQRYRPYSSGLSGAGRNFTLSANLKFR